MRGRPRSARTKELIRAAALRSWRSGTRRRRRTKREMIADGWAPRPRRRERGREPRPAIERGATIFDLGHTMRRLTVAELLRPVAARGFGAIAGR